MLVDFIRGIPKVELHLHIEGTLEPELMLDFAARNGVDLGFESVEAVRAAYSFADLEDFLDIYYRGTRVLQTERDFYDLTWSYLQRVHGENVRHTEIFFDPQTHTDRGVAFETVIEGVHRARLDAQSKLSISCQLIMCFLRHLSPASAMATLEHALPYRDWIVAVGLDSSEVGNPPRKFVDVFDRARAEGLLAVAHAGEEGPPEYIWEALDLLHVRRIDHGVRCLEDPRLVDRLVADQIPLTVCPLSNVQLDVFERIEDHNLKRLLDHGLLVTVNSDDPAYFGGYITDNLLAAHAALGLDEYDVECLSRNAIRASFLGSDGKERLLAEVDEFVKTSNAGP